MLVREVAWATCIIRRNYYGFNQSNYANPHLPMNTVGLSVGIFASGVDYEVSNLPEEIVLVGVPLSTSIQVGVGIEES